MNDNELEIESLRSGEENRMEPTDRYFLTYILFYALGMLTQVPQNFFITANSFWMYKFRNTSNAFDPSNKNKTELQVQFTSNFSMVSQITSVAFLFLTVFLARRVSPHKRVIISLSTMLLLFMLTIVCVDVNTDSWQGGFYAISMIIGCLLNGCSSSCMITVFQLSSKFPPQYLAAQLSGQAICGIFAALIQILSLTNGAEHIKPNAFIYFSTGAFVVFLTLMFYLYHCKTSEYYIEYERADMKKYNGRPSKELLLQVFHKIKYFLIAMVLVPGASITIHPGLTSLVQSVGSGSAWNSTFFIPVVTYLFYNLFDFIGREAAPHILKPKNGIVIMILAIVRVTFVPLIMLCNAQPRSHMPVIFNSDTAYIIFMIVFSLTNGYLLNMCILSLPSVTAEEERTASFLIIILVMFISLVACSFLNSLMIKLL